MILVEKWVVLWQKADSGFPIRILFYKQRQLAIILDKGLTSSECMKLLSENLKKEFNYISSWSQVIDRESTFWSYYKFMEIKLFVECSQRKKELVDLICINNWSIQTEQ